MIAGLALEALAKGILVAEAPARIGAGAAGRLSLEWQTTEHLSVQLLSRAGLDPSPAERLVIDRLSMFVRWAGRYPVPKLVSELGPGYRDEDRGAFWAEDDFATVDALYARLRLLCDAAVVTKL